MTTRGFSGFTALVVSLAALGGASACGDDAADGGDDDDGSAGDGAGTGGTIVGGATATGGSSGGTSTGGSGLGTGTGGNGLATGNGGSNAAGATGKGGGPAEGGTANAGRAGSTGGSGGSGGMLGPPDGNWPNSPYEVECHGDTAMCGSPTALLCLGLRIGTEVLGYSCANECQSDADCSDKPATTDAASGCVDFVNKKYCLLVCKDGEEEASCPSGMYCYVYEGTTKGYCLWH